MEEPSITILGAPSVGKASILSKLMQTKRAAPKGTSSHSWTIENKYYTAAVTIYIASLVDDLPSSNSEALIMVFDLSNDTTFANLQTWASRVDLTSFGILLCIGNKADKLPDHYGHTEYRRKVQSHAESASDPHPEFLDFGIQRSEGSELLDDGNYDGYVQDDGTRRSRIEWCVNHGIEYIEACALDDAFDECISIDGDLQGIARIRGALDAHMWPGMVMKAQRKLSEANSSSTEPSSSCLAGFTSSDESDFTIEYELLSNEGFSDLEPDPREEQQQEQQAEGAAVDEVAAVQPNEDVAVQATENAAVVVESVASGEASEPSSEQVRTEPAGKIVGTSSSKDEASLEAIEQFMQEMSGMRENLRTMPDAQRREMASQIALRMASMFMDDGDDE